MPKIKPVCKGCEDRHTLCHMDCEKYIKAKEEYYEKKNVRYAEKVKEGEWFEAITRKKRR